MVADPLVLSGVRASANTLLIITVCIRDRYYKIHRFPISLSWANLSAQQYVISSSIQVCNVTPVDCFVGYTSKLSLVFWHLFMLRLRIYIITRAKNDNLNYDIHHVLHFNRARDNYHPSCTALTFKIVTNTYIGNIEYVCYPVKPNALYPIYTIYSGFLSHVKKMPESISYH